MKVNTGVSNETDLSVPKINYKSNEDVRVQSILTGHSINKVNN